MSFINNHFAYFKLRHLIEFLLCSIYMGFCLQEEARSTITRMLNELEFGVSEACVRINSVESGLAEDDLNLVMTSERLPKTLMLPKVEEPAHLEWVGIS